MTPNPRKDHLHMAKQSETPSLPAFDEPAKPKTRLVNRNAHLAAAAKIVAILEKVDPSKWPAVLRIVNDSLQFQPELPGLNGQEVK